MQVLLGSQLKTLEGEMLPDLQGNPAVLRGVCIEALMAQFEDERNLSGEEKLKRFELALKIKQAVDPAEFTAEEIALMKKLIGKGYGPLIVGQTWKMLEGKE